jgi:tetratricopeptide (TPR) repeat protein
LFTRKALDVGGNDPRLVRKMVQQVQALAARAERTTEADHRFQHALELAPNIPDVWVAYIRYLSATGQNQTVREVLARARANDNLKDGSVELGLCFEAVGELVKAEEQFKQAVDQHPEAAVVRATASFYLRQGLTPRAEPYLDRILQREIKVTDADLAWAKRARAIVLASGNDYRKFQQALPLVGMKLDPRTGLAVEVNVPAAGEIEETLRSRARVLASAGIGPLRKQAIDQLKEVETRGRLQPDDRFLLAELYEAGGDRTWPRARALLRALAAEHKNPDYVNHLAQSLLFYKEFKEATRVIDQLARLEKTRTGQPGAYGSIDLRSRLLELTGRPDQALTLLRDYAAEKPIRAERLLALAGLLARLHRVSEALEQCEKIQGLPPEVIAGAAIGLLRSSQPAAKDLSRVESFLKAALARNPASVILRVQLADLHDLRGRYADAEVLYRQVLDKEKQGDPDNIMALNNLAWLLARNPQKGAEAEKLINHALEVLGPRPELLDTRAVVYLSLGKSEQAIADLKRANADAPSPARYFHLARALHMARQPGEALKAFEKARAAGLEPKTLHPAERVEFDQINKALYPR